MEERSAGAVLFTNRDGGRKYLLLRYPAGHWDFPKGNMERGETEKETAIREVKEETGLENLKLIDGFRRQIEYFYRRDGKSIHKQVVYLLAEPPSATVKLSFEHQDFGWFKFPEALEKVTYANSKKTLTEAQRFLDAKVG
jgi:bis(5'-nucleosidyl)-tetraphosphatase